MKDGGRVLVVALMMAVLCCSAVTPLTPTQRHQLLLDYDDDSDSTSKSTTSTIPITSTIPTTTAESTTPAQSTTTTPAKPTTPVQSSTSTPASISDEDLFQQTEDELEDISHTLNQFMKFVKNESEDDLVWQRHPFAWWHEVLSHTTDTERLTQLADTSCIKNTGICYNIQQTLQDIDQQMDILKSNTDMWGIACLKQLRKNSEQLTNLTTEAEEESDFTAEIDKENFCDLLKESQTAVTTGKAAVEHKLADLKKVEQNRIILASVVGTLGGLMILAILATLCFSVSKRHSGIKKTPVSRDNRKEQNNVYMSTVQPSPEPVIQPLASPNDVYTRPHAPKSNHHYTAREATEAGPSSPYNKRYPPGPYPKPLTRLPRYDD